MRFFKFVFILLAIPSLAYAIDYTYRYPTNTPMGVYTSVNTDANFLKLDASNDPLTAGLSIVGSADEVQLYVMSNATQTSNVFLFEKSDGTNLLEMTNGGTMTLAGAFLSGSYVKSTRSGTTTTSIDGLWAQNFNAATSTNPVRISPRLRLTGYGWDTNGAGSSKAWNFKQEMIPISGNPVTGYCLFGIDPGTTTYTNVGAWWDLGEFGIGTGTTRPTGQLMVQGTQDITQLRVVGNATQTNNIALFENSAGLDLLALTGTGDLNLDGNSAHTFSMNRHTTAATAGNNLTLSSGGAVSGGTDLNGGDVYIKSGIATGTGSSNILFQTTTAGTTGTTDRNPTTKVSILGSGKTGIGNAAPDALVHIGSTSSKYTSPNPSLFVGDNSATNSFSGIYVYGTTAQIMLENTGGSGREFRIQSDSGGRLDFYDVGTGGYFTMDSLGHVGINRDPDTWEFEVTGDAGKTVGGTDWNAISDSRFKNIIGEVKGLEVIKKLKPIKYKWNDLHTKKFGDNSDDVMYGFTAQNVREVLPEMVTEDKEGFLWYNPSGFEAVLTQAIQEQQQEINTLREEVKELKKAR